MSWHRWGAHGLGPLWPHAGRWLGLQPLDAAAERVFHRRRAVCIKLLFGIGIISLLCAARDSSAVAVGWLQFVYLAFVLTESWPTCVTLARLGAHCPVVTRMFFYYVFIVSHYLVCESYERRLIGGAAFVAWESLHLAAAARIFGRCPRGLLFFVALPAMAVAIGRTVSSSHAGRIGQEWNLSTTTLLGLGMVSSNLARRGPPRSFLVEVASCLVRGGLARRRPVEAPAPCPAPAADAAPRSDDQQEVPDLVGSGATSLSNETPSINESMRGSSSTTDEGHVAAVVANPRDLRVAAKDDIVTLIFICRHRQSDMMRHAISNVLLHIASFLCARPAKAISPGLDNWEPRTPRRRWARRAGNTLRWEILGRSDVAGRWWEVAAINPWWVVANEYGLYDLDITGHESDNESRHSADSRDTFVTVSSRASNLSTGSLTSTGSLSSLRHELLACVSQAT